MDIVAIETLTERRLESWQKEQDGGHVLWLKDPEFLPSRIPNSRVFSFGYTLAGNFTLELLADALLRSVCENRHEDEVCFLSSRYDLSVRMKDVSYLLDMASVDSYVWKYMYWLSTSQLTIRLSSPPLGKFKIQLASWKLPPLFYYWAYRTELKPRSGASFCRISCDQWLRPSLTASLPHLQATHI